MKHKPTRMSCYSSYGVTTPWKNSEDFHDHFSRTKTEILVIWDNELVDNRSFSRKLNDREFNYFTYYYSYLDKSIFLGRSINQFLGAIYHLVDFMSDIIYLNTVPIYSSILLNFFQIFIVIPLIIILVRVYNMPGMDNGDRFRSLVT